MEKYIETPVPKEGDQVKCGICFHKFGSPQSARKHLISRHQIFLAEKLEDEQKSGETLHEIQEKLLKMNGGKTIRKKWRVETGSDFHDGASTVYTNKNWIKI